MVERRARVADWREFKSRIIGGGGDNRIGERFVAVAFNWAKVNSPTIWHSSKEWEQPLFPERSDFHTSRN